MGTAALLLAVVASRQAGLAARATAIENRLLDELDRWAGTRALILDLEATTRLDTTSVDVLIDLVDELNRRDITLYLARVLHPVNGVLQRSGFLDLLGDDHSWHSISQRVRAARRDLGLKHESATSPDGPSDNDTTTIGAAAPTSDSDAAAARYPNACYRETFDRPARPAVAGTLSPTWRSASR